MKSRTVTRLSKKPIGMGPSPISKKNTLSTIDGLALRTTKESSARLA